MNRDGITNLRATPRSAALCRLVAAIEAAGRGNILKVSLAMSRSKRKTPIAGNTVADSDKCGKVRAHRVERRRVRRNLARGSELMPHRFETGNPWNWPKDGKCYFGDRPASVMRK